MTRTVGIGGHTVIGHDPQPAALERPGAAGGKVAVLGPGGVLENAEPGGAIDGVLSIMVGGAAEGAGERLGKDAGMTFGHRNGDSEG